MKTLKIVISSFITGVGVSFTVFYILTCIFHLSIADTLEVNTTAFFWTGGFCGMAFAWFDIEFKSELMRFMSVVISFTTVLAISFLIITYGYNLTVPAWIYITWIFICLLIYMSVYVYNILLAKQLNAKIQKNLKENNLL